MVTIYIYSYRGRKKQLYRLFGEKIKIKIRGKKKKKILKELNKLDRSRDFTFKLEF